MEDVGDEQIDIKSLWINPKPTQGKDTFYKVLESNDFFEMLEHISTNTGFNSFLVNNLRKFSTNIVPFSFKIIILDEQNNCIAVAEEKEKIYEKWEWIKVNVYPQINKDQRNRDKMLQLLNYKFSQKAEEKVVAKIEEDRNFNKLFDLPNDECIEYFGCTFWQHPIHYPGRLFVSTNHICFHSLFLPIKLRISLQDVRKIEKSISLGKLDYSIKLEAINRSNQPEEYFFAAFFSRDQAYNVMMQQWNKMCHQGDQYDSHKETYSHPHDPNIRIEGEDLLYLSDSDNQIDHSDDIQNEIDRFFLHEYQRNQNQNNNNNNQNNNQNNNDLRKNNDDDFNKDNNNVNHNTIDTNDNSTDDDSSRTISISGQNLMDSLLFESNDENIKVDTTPSFVSKVGNKIQQQLNSLNNTDQEFNDIILNNENNNQKTDKKHKEDPPKD